MNKQAMTNLDLKQINIPAMIEWAEALESGDYEQTSGKLRAVDFDDDVEGSLSNRFCCLGVYCDVQSKKPRGGRWTYDGDYSSYGSVSGEVVPRSVARKAGWFLKNGETSEFEGKQVREVLNPSVQFRALPAAFAELNDVDQLSFKQIARKVRWLIQAATEAQA